MVSVGTIVWLSSELMFFAGLFAMYFTARAQAGGNWPPPPTELNLYQAVPVTLVLIASSFTCQMGVFAAERGDVFGLRRWYVITFLMGLFFVLGPGLRVLPPGHARHHDPGQRLRQRVLPGHRLPRPARHRRADRLHLPAGPHHDEQVHPGAGDRRIVVSYYWHFVDIVWIALFATIYFIR